MSSPLIRQRSLVGFRIVEDTVGYEQRSRKDGECGAKRDKRWWSERSCRYALSAPKSGIAASGRSLTFPSLEVATTAWKEVHKVSASCVSLELCKPPYVSLMRLEMTDYDGLRGSQVEGEGEPETAGEVRSDMSAVVRRSLQLLLASWRLLSSIVTWSRSKGAHRRRRVKNAKSRWQWTVSVTAGQ